MLMKYDGVFGGEWRRRVLRSSKLIVVLYHALCPGISIGKWKLLWDNYLTSEGGRERKKHYLIFRYCMSNINTPAGYH